MSWGRQAEAFFSDERAQSEWSSVYLILVFLIAALLLIAVIKPMFQQSQQIVTKAQKQAQKGSS